MATSWWRPWLLGGLFLAYASSSALAKPQDDAQGGNDASPGNDADPGHDARGRQLGRANATGVDPSRMAHRVVTVFDPRK